MRMRVSLIGFAAACLFVCLTGCKGIHFRPGNVPSSAVWIDNTFIDCSMDRQSRANRCTVYKDDTGEILADGLFLLKTSQAAVDKSELRYAAFGNGMIYLQDARVLVPWIASERDPSHKRIKDRLKALATRGSSQAIDCSNAGSAGKAGESAVCVLKAFAGRKAFYVCYYQQGIYSFDFKGISGDEAGNVYEVDYASTSLMGVSYLPKDEQLLDDNHTLVVPCRKPVAFVRTERGSLTCTRTRME
jgi:hypothetical protein